jgi:hypothetical protein
MISKCWTYGKLSGDKALPNRFRSGVLSSIIRKLTYGIAIHKKSCFFYFRFQTIPLNPGYSYLTSKLGTRSNRPQAGGGAVFWLLLQLVSFGQFHIRLADLPRSKDVEAQPATAAGVAPAV